MSDVVSADETTIHYERVGEGPAVVLLHGFSSGLTAWRRAGYVDALRETYSTIAIDARAHGRSDAPRGADAYTPERMVGDILAVLDAERIDQAILWGYSMGARLVRHLYERAPERVLAAVIGAHAPIEPTNDGASSPQVRALRKGRAAFIDLLTRAGLTVTDELRETLQQNDPEALADLWSALRSWPKSAPRFECPALLYAGDRDEVHDALREYALTLPNATFRSVPGADHGSGFAESSVLPFVAEFLASSPAT